MCCFFFHSGSDSCISGKSVYKEVRAVWVFWKNSVENLFLLVMYPIMFLKPECCEPGVMGGNSFFYCTYIEIASMNATVF